MRRLICRLRGHRWVVARSLYPTIIPDGAGLTLRWRAVYPLDERGDLAYNGMGCTRCGRFRFLQPGDGVVYPR